MASGMQTRSALCTGGFGPMSRPVALADASAQALMDRMDRTRASWQAKADALGWSIDQTRRRFDPQYVGLEYAPPPRPRPTASAREHAPAKPKPKRQSHGLGPSQTVALRRLADGVLRTTDIASALGVSSPAASWCLNRLAERRLVRRVAGSRNRGWHWAATAAGMAILQAIDAEASDV
ncbi:MAG: MarR family transcriptional regulator [Caulobacteraceae bacterium]